MITIEEYASKWATVDHRAALKCPEYIAPSRRQIFFQWAVADPDSPIAAALKDGVPEQEVETQFDDAYDQMLNILARMEG